MNYRTLQRCCMITCWQWSMFFATTMTRYSPLWFLVSVALCFFGARFTKELEATNWRNGYSKGANEEM